MVFGLLAATGSPLRAMSSPARTRLAPAPHLRRHAPSRRTSLGPVWSARARPRQSPRHNTANVYGTLDRFLRLHASSQGGRTGARRRRRRERCGPRSARRRTPADTGLGATRCWSSPQSMGSGRRTRPSRHQTGTGRARTNTGRAGDAADTHVSRRVAGRGRTDAGDPLPRSARRTMSMNESSEPIAM